MRDTLQTTLLHKRLVSTTAVVFAVTTLAVFVSLLMLFAQTVNAAPGFRKDHSYFEAYGDSSAGSRSTGRGFSPSATRSNYQQGFHGSLMKNIGHNNLGVYLYGERTQKEYLLIYTSLAYTNQLFVTSPPAYGGRYEFGMLDNLGVGFSGGGSMYEAHGYSNLSMDNMIMAALYLEGWNSEDLPLYSESMNWLYLFRKQKVTVFAPRWAQLELTYHPYENSTWDPYIRIFGGGGDERAYGGYITTYGSSWGIRYFVYDYLYPYAALTIRGMDIHRKKKFFSIEKQGPGGHLADHRVEAGLGVRLENLELPDLWSLDDEEQRQIIRMIRSLKRVPGVELVVRDNRLVIIMLGRGYFPSGSDQILAPGRKTVIRLARIFSRAPNFDLEIEGHTDSDPVIEGGRFDDNEELSEARAERVMELMIQQGMDSWNLDYEGYGQTRPRRPNTTAENKQLNRRIEIVLEADLSNHPRILRMVR